MKNIILITTCLAAVLITGCFVPSRKTESVHSTETFNDQGKLIAREIRRDRSKAGAIALFADPKASQISSIYTNQTKLGGGSTFNVGEVESTTSTDGIEAVGNAGGKLLNSAVTGGND